MRKARVLFVSQEITPYLDETHIGKITRRLPQAIQERGKEIRTFMPKYGNINERRHQLHEVIRLSGMNIVINNADHPLIIKVASIPTARMQVYFIDNDDYFQRKSVLTDKATGKYFDDNDERAIFFNRGVIETVKKLGWAPDVIHCHGWFTGLMPIYIKKAFAEDPLFSDTKIIFTVYDEEYTKALNKKIVDKAIIDGVTKKDLKHIEDASYINLMKLAIDHSDGIAFGSEVINPEIEKYAKKSGKPVLAYKGEAEYTDAYNEFYDLVLEDTEVLAD
ncbi:MAG: glycogen/starch synthase [Bacteroidota bacterium]